MGSQRVRHNCVTEQNLINSIAEHLPSLNQDQHFQVSVTGRHQYPGQAEEPANVATWTQWSQFLLAFQCASELFIFQNVKARCGKLR